MQIIPISLLLLGFLAGQLIKIPIGSQGGLIFLDLVVVLLDLVGIFSLKFRLKRTPLFVKTFLLFLFICIISLVFSPIKLNQLETVVSISYPIRLFLYITLGWLFVNGAFPNLYKNLTPILITTGLGLSILGILQFLFLPDLRFLQKDLWDPHYFRTASTFLDPNFLGSFLVLTLALIFQNPNNKEFKVRTKIAFFIIIFIVLLTTFSRGAYLAFLITFLALSLFKKSLKLSALTIILFLTLISGFFIYQKFVAEPRGVDKSQSAEYRLNSWQQGFNLFTKFPILGVGFNTYKFALKQYGLADDKFLQSRGATTNDSSLLYVLSTTGIVGLSFYLLFLFSIFKSGVKFNSWGQIISAGILGTVAQSFFINNLFYPFIFLWIILSASKIQVLEDQKK